MKVDRVKIPDGFASLPSVFRELARVANAAGLEGYSVVDVDVGLDLEVTEKTGFPESRVEITYARKAGGL